MSHLALTPGLLTRAAILLAPGVSILLTLGIVLLAAAWVVSQPVLGLSVVTLGVTFVALGLLVWLLSLRYENARRSLEKTLAALLEHDASPGLTTDLNGFVTFQNRAAKDYFTNSQARPEKEARALTDVLGDLFAAPEAVLKRLQNKAEISGSAREDIVVRHGYRRLSVHLVGKTGLLWRLEDISDKAPAGRNGETINLPMMTVSQSGTILFMNEALRRLLGGRQASLDRVFVDLPLRNGMTTEVSAKDGNIKVLICEILSTAGRREIYLLPEPENYIADSGDWNPVDMLPVPLLRLDADGYVTMANQRAKALLGDENAIGTLLSDQVEGAGRPISEWLREVMAGRLSGRSEVVRALNPDDEVYLQVSLERMQDPQGPVIVAVLQDATELKSMEAQYLQAQKMQSLGQLAGGIAHDFNNLLTAISGHCDLLILRHEETDPDYADLAQIHQNANRAATLVGKLLSFSRKQTLNPEILDLTELLGDLAHLLNRLIPETIQLDLVQDENLAPIRADRHHLEQVLVNLVVNSRDAMPDGGNILLETRNVQLSEALERDRVRVPAGAYVMIRIEDQGCGIPQDKLTKIFEPFFTTKGVGKGTGLGLSMAYGIIKQSGGYIFVDSSVGSGTSFTLYLPVLEEVENELECQKTPPTGLPENGDEGGSENRKQLAVLQNGTAQIRPETLKAREAELVERILSDEGVSTVPVPPETGEVEEAAEAYILGKEEQIEDELPRPTHDFATKDGGIVLLVEDEAPVRAFASRALRMRGFTVLEAENAEEALRTLEDESLTVDIFVTDVIMPGMDGPTWVARALESRPDVKVVFVSGYAEDSISEHQARIPNSVFLPKPFSLSELTTTVQSQFH